MSTAHAQPRRPIVARLIRTLAVPIILFWLLLAAALGLISPPLEAVGEAKAAPVAPQNLPAYQGMMRIGAVFKEFDSDSAAMVVLEGHDKLGDSAHAFCDKVVAKLNADHTHVEHVQDFWSDPLTAAGSQSVDGKAAYVQVFLRGSQGTRASDQSVAALRDIVGSVPAPAGVKAYVAGTSVLTTDLTIAGHNSLAVMALVSGGVIFLMLLIVYRSIVTTVISLLIVGMELFAAQGVTATAANSNLVGLTPIVVSLITMLCLAAGTDYVIFLLGRYHEARALGEDRERAFYTAYHGVSHVILGSGLTVAGACLCLEMATLPYLRSNGWPCAIALLVIMAAALTLAPAVLAVASRFGLLEAKRELSTRGWRKVGTVAVRWPVPIILVSAIMAIIGFVSLLTYTPGYNYGKYTPAEMPANVAQTAAERHFSAARINPEVLMLEADHDLRNPADLLVIDRVAKSLFHLRGIARVQTITRPLGAPIEHSSIPFLISMQNANTLQTMKIQNDNTAQMLEQANELTTAIANMERMYTVTKEIVATTHTITAQTHDMRNTTNKLRDSIADFDDVFRPVRSYFYWEPHCFDIPLCWSLRSLFDSIDGIDQLADKFQTLTGSLDRLDALMPQLLATLPPTIESMKAMRDFILSTHNTMAGIAAHMQELAEGSTMVGQYFDEARNDDSFYLPPEAFKSPDFQRGLKMFVSPDGKAVRIIITLQGDPASVDGIEHAAGIRDTVTDAVKGTPLENAKVSLGGTASLFNDMHHGTIVDVAIALISAMILIFAIMLLITRSVVAALVIVGTVAASLGTGCGLSVLLWQDLLGLDIDWLIIPMSAVILLAVGSDYNLLVVARLREDIHAGLNTGIIRALGATGRVVTAAGLVFAFTMLSMVVSHQRMIGQFGTTIGIGILFDTLVVRAFMTPSIAAMLGRWFWWPLNTFKITQRHKSPRRTADETHTALVPVRAGDRT
jgi:putative drug exporter of the RND superfamily